MPLVNNACLSVWPRSLALTVHHSFECKATTIGLPTATATVDVRTGMSITTTFKFGRSSKNYDVSSFSLIFRFVAVALRIHIDGSQTFNLDLRAILQTGRYSSWYIIIQFVVTVSCYTDSGSRWVRFFIARGIFRPIRYISDILNQI